MNSKNANLTTELTYKLDTNPATCNKQPSFDKNPWVVHRNIMTDVNG